MLGSFYTKVAGTYKWDAFTEALTDAKTDLFCNIEVTIYRIGLDTVDTWPKYDVNVKRQRRYINHHLKLSVFCTINIIGEPIM